MLANRITQPWAVVGLLFVAAAGASAGNCATAIGSTEREKVFGGSPCAFGCRETVTTCTDPTGISSTCTAVNFYVCVQCKMSVTNYKKCKDVEEGMNQCCATSSTNYCGKKYSGERFENGNCGLCDYDLETACGVQIDSITGTDCAP